MLSSFAVPVNVTSTNASDTLALTTYINFRALPYIFTNFIFPNTSVDPGSAFSFSLDPYLNNKTATVNATVQPAAAASWLTFHSKNLSLTGTAPKNPNYSHVDVLFTASAGAMTATSTLNLTLTGVTATDSSTGTAAVPSSTGEAGGSGGGGLSKGGKIALGVVFGLLGLIALLLLLLFCCRKRRKDRKEKEKDDGDSFVVGSPVADPFRKSNTLDPPRNLLGEIARFSGFHLNRPEDRAPPLPGADERPTRMDGLKGIFGWGEQPNIKEKDVSPQPNNNSGSFLGQGDVISVRDPVDRPSQEASSFTQTFGSSTYSRASWESRDSFHWSSGENGDSNENAINRVSTTPSIPRPRQDFTPRYPRQNSPSQLAQLASQHTLGSPEMSDNHESGDSLSGSMQSNSFGSSFANPSQNQSRSHFGESGGFRSIDEEEEGDTTDAEGPAVVSMAERQSFETRTPRRTASGSRHQFRQSRLSNHQSSRSLHDEGMFDDADEARRSMAVSERDVQGLGYPASSIFGSPGSNATRGVSYMSDNRDSYLDDNGADRDPNRASTIRAIPPQAPLVLSPPLPQVGSFVRDRQAPGQPFVIPQPQTGDNRSSGQVTTDGRVIACANETFSMHPTINPPPRIALSAATWSSAPPSTYRAEVIDGDVDSASGPSRTGSAAAAASAKGKAKAKPLPTWLHFDARELELWGVPALGNAGEVTTIRVMESLPRDKRNSDPGRFGYEPQQEREVGRVTVE